MSDQPNPPHDADLLPANHGREHGEEHSKEHSANDSDLLSEDTMATLLLHAGPRKAAPDALKHSVFNVVQGAWQEKINRQAAQRRRTVWAIAATVVLCVGAAWMLFRPSLDPASTPALTSTSPVATVEAWFSSSPSPFAAGMELEAGTELATLGSERAALRLGSGLSLRLDHDTRVKLMGERTVDLLTGTVYVDSGLSGELAGPPTDSRQPRIEIRTHLGNTTDIGTQFEVRVDGQALRVQVREGAVRVDVDGEYHAAEAGTEIAVTGGEVKKTSLPAERDWSWAIQTAPAFELDGSNVADALDWVARETGWSLHYQDAALEEEARHIVTRGSLSGLTPDQAPELIIPTAGLKYAIDGERLIVQRGSPPK